jgi:PRTRC genetic system protein C
MTIQLTEIQRVFRYNGVALPDVPGMTPREVRDLYSAQYPELISAEIQTGEVVNGVQEYTFRKAVGTKGRTGREGERFAALKAAIARESEGAVGSDAKLARAIARSAMRKCAGAWADFVMYSMRDMGERHAARVMPVSDMLTPLP